MSVWIKHYFRPESQPSQRDDRGRVVMHCLGCCSGSSAFWSSHRQATRSGGSTIDTAHSHHSLTTIGATNSKWAEATPCIPTEDCSDQNFAICEIAARRENLATSTWREAKWSDTLQITDDMVHTFYKWHGHQDCKFDNVYDVLMVVRFSNLMGEFRWE